MGKYLFILHPPFENSTTRIAIMKGCQGICNSQPIYIYIFFQTSGPSLPKELYAHSMVKLGKGQAVLGGVSSYYYNGPQAEIYSMTCSNRNCIISLLNRELSVPNTNFVAIPIPDTISGCITGGKKYFQKKIYTAIHSFHPQI